ncbi:helix-turn-helix domain-containing protein [Streptomyces silaceus]|uniref:helix-turn-helix domain-containing protein n=1 Tax=Streptomyces silaceus TaxID=545123 RepID=UPI000A5A5923|nr:helix-turn-helix domain-containing protein [Streptomyces silaceus]
MIDASRGRRIEQNARGTATGPAPFGAVARGVAVTATRSRAVAVTEDAVVFTESRAYEVARHRHPAWKLVLPDGGHARVGERAGAGVLVPPQYTHTCATSSAFVAALLEPWCVRASPAGPTWLDRRTVRRLLAAARDGAGPDAEALRTELVALTGPAPVVDPRIPQAVRASARATRIDTVAADLGLSPARLRALIATEVGIPLSTLRQWRRLRAAVAALVDGSGTGGIAGAAADAGFADQAHLTRAVRRFAGRTPGSLRRP